MYLIMEIGVLVVEIRKTSWLIINKQQDKKYLSILNNFQEDGASLIPLNEILFSSVSNCQFCVFHKSTRSQFLDFYNHEFVHF